MHDITLESDENIIILGDIHGQFPDFLKVIEKEGLPNKKRKYVRIESFKDSFISFSYLMVILLIEAHIPWNVC